MERKPEEESGGETMNATCQTEAGEPRPCGVMAAIDRIEAKMYVFDDILAMLKLLVERREKERLRQSEYYRRRRENSTLKKDSTLKKETEKGKRNFPLEPLYREKGKEKETAPSTSCARACEVFSPPPDPLVEADYLKPNRPTLEEVIAWAEVHNPQRYPEGLLREWYGECEFCGWHDRKGFPIRNWQAHLHVWREYYEVRRRIKDPDRIPDARKPTGRRVHADNWRPTRKEDIQNAF